MAESTRTPVSASILVLLILFEIYRSIQKQVDILVNVRWRTIKCDSDFGKHGIHASDWKRDGISDIRLDTSNCGI